MDLNQDLDPKEATAQLLSLDEDEILSARFEGEEALIVVTKSGQKIKVSEGEDDEPKVDILIGPGRDTEEVEAPSAEEVAPQAEDLPPLEGVSSDSPLPAVDDDVESAARQADAGEGPGDVDNDGDVDQADLDAAGEGNLGEPEDNVLAQPDEAQAPAAAQLDAEPEAPKAEKKPASKSRRKKS